MPLTECAWCADEYHWLPCPQHKPINIETMSFNKAKRNRGNRKVLISLFKKYKGRCAYCGCMTVLPARGTSGRLADNAATIEHLYDNYSIVRLLLKKWSKTTLACFACNNDRARERNIELNAEYKYNPENDGLLISLLNNSTHTIH